MDKAIPQSEMEINFVISLTCIHTVSEVPMSERQCGLAILFAVGIVQ
jgi:hypothetical protein